MSASVFILSACSGDKAVDEPAIDCEEIDRTSHSALLDRYPDVSMPAESLYTGDEHEHIKAAVEQFEEIADVEWRIISAGFGLVRPETELPAYECTFRDDESVRRRVERFGYDSGELTKAERIETVAGELGIPTALEQTLDARFDVMFVALGQDYLISTGSALSSIPDQTTAFAFAPKGSRDQIGNCQWIPSTETERDALNTLWTKVKGRQLRNVANSITAAEDLLDLHSTESIRERSLRRPSE